MDHHAVPAKAQSASPAAVDRVRTTLAGFGLDHLQIQEFEATTATAASAATAIGTSVGRIVKSLVFMAADRPILVLVSGPNRVDLQKLASLLGQHVKRASPDQVRELTGFAIGGVPPVGHSATSTTYVDRDLLQYDQVWAAAGTPNSVFAIRPTDLVRITGGCVEDLAQSV